MGLPVSTTHVSSSAIVGIGLLKGVSAVHWTTVRDMVLAWIVTLPAGGLLAGFLHGAPAVRSGKTGGELGREE